MRSPLAPTEPLRGDDRRDPVADEGEQALDELGTYPRVAAGEGRRSHEHDRQGLLGAQRRADAAAVVANKVVG